MTDLEDLVWAQAATEVILQFNPDEDLVEVILIGKRTDNEVYK